MQTEQQLLEEISRLRNAISRRRRAAPPRPPHPAVHRGLSNAAGSSTASRDVVINGATFRSSGTSLVRGAAPAITQTPTPMPMEGRPAFPMHHHNAPPSPRPTTMTRIKKLSLVATNRLKMNHRPTSAALVLPARGAYQARALRRGGPARRGTPHPATRRNKSTTRRLSSVSINKPCREFTRRGVCLNGLKCRYNHDPEQVAICPKFLSDECPLDESSCPLSHKSTPERVPICVHFTNGARCRNGSSCKYPHIRLGPKDGVCRDFAVLGYCARGVDCEHQHVRECPDFASTGTCPLKGCRLPHVIRAQHKENAEDVTAVDAQHHPKGHLPSIPSGDFISLTFNESSDEGESSDEDVHLKW